MLVRALLPLAVLAFSLGEASAATSSGFRRIANIIAKKNTGLLRFFNEPSPHHDISTQAEQLKSEIKGLADTFWSVGKRLREEMAADEAKAVGAREYSNHEMIRLQLGADAFESAAAELEKTAATLGSQRGANAQRLAEAKAQARAAIQRATGSALSKTLVFFPEDRPPFLDELARGPDSSKYELYLSMLEDPRLRDDLVDAEVFYEGLALLLRNWYITLDSEIFRQKGVACNALIEAMKKMVCSEKMIAEAVEICAGIARAVAGPESNPVASAAQHGAGIKA